ncbi:DNA polymerase III [Magnetospirillum sp. SS-4]|uniref:DNA polymerase III n=1 Tax=Magnetospirillum sp. SS-4 TaxID=2681465 RepID=UPI00138409DD|nr:DNA polymerase III [Magnetospirillum sp. SS-4]CAA7623126.1 DNA polymerase III [Magnetospirillum sp. SS-4]
MTSGAIPPAPPAAASPVPAPAGTVVAVAAGAEALARLPAGALVTATVRSVEARNVIQVVTGGGEILDLKLPPNVRIPQGAELTFQLIQQGNLPALKLLSVNGRPFGGMPQPGLPQLPAMADLPDLGMAGPLAGRATPPGPGTPQGAPPPLSGSPAVHGPGQPAAATPPGLTATVVRPAASPPLATAQNAAMPGQASPPSSSPLPAGLADLVPGTQLTVRIAGVVPPPPGTPPPQSQPMPGSPLSPSPLAAGPPPAATPPPQGTPLGAPPPSPPPISAPTAGPAAAAPAPPLLSGTVVSAPQQIGPTLVQTPAGLLALPAGTNLPPGGTVQLEVVGRPIPPPPPITAPPPQGLGPAGWPTLSAVADTLARTDRQALEHLVRLIPQANPQLAAAMSQFAGAVRAGDARHLARDDVVKGLDKAGRRDLADRLKADFLSLASEAKRPLGGGEWQGITMPFAHGAEIEPIRLYVQGTGEEGEKGRRKGQEQRFILDVTMSRLGRIQFDGLVSREARRFDLIVRTLEPLASDIRRDIAGIFAECGQMTGVIGNVGFQSGRGFIDLPPTDASGTRIVV